MVVVQKLLQSTAKNPVQQFAVVGAIFQIDQFYRHDFTALLGKLIQQCRRNAKPNL
jgi:hypothetical protein